MTRKKAKRLRSGQHVSVAGRTLTVAITKLVHDEKLGELVEVRFIDGTVIRRAPHALLDVI